MAIEVPTLSSAGWLSGPAEKIDRLMSYYFTSERSQSTLFAGSVVSLPYHLQKYSHDEGTLREVIRDALRDYLEPHFDQVVVNIRTDVPNPDDPGRINLTFDVELVQDGVRYSAGRLIETHNGSMLKLINLNNQGTEND